jgi:hypothetical protein
MFVELSNEFRVAANETLGSLEVKFGSLSVKMKAYSFLLFNVIFLFSDVLTDV